MGRLLPLLIVACFLLLPFQNVFATSHEEYFRKGYRVSFNPPHLILDCGSFFYLNVTLYKVAPAPPCSIYVFLKTIDSQGLQRIKLIGYLPFVKVGLGEQKSVKVPCFTSINLPYKIACLKEGRKEKFGAREAYIGVKIKYARPTLQDAAAWIIVRRLSKEIMNEQFWKRAILYGVIPSRIMRWMAFERWLDNGMTWIRKCNPGIIWKRTKTISPFVYSDAIDFKIISPNKTIDTPGNFDIKMRITNHLDEDINITVVADLTPEQFINSLFPTARETRYNVGAVNGIVKAGKGETFTMHCHFPPGGWSKKKYLIRVECGPYIYIGNSNQFGIYTYNIRWGMFIKPNYKVNGSVQEQIKELWYNLPIFLKNGPDLFPTGYVSVNYTGPAPEEKLVSMIKNATKNITKAAIFFFSAIAILIIAMTFILYILIRRKYL